MTVLQIHPVKCDNAYTNRNKPTVVFHNLIQLVGIVKYFRISLAI